MIELLLLTTGLIGADFLTPTWITSGDEYVAVELSAEQHSDLYYYGPVSTECQYSPVAYNSWGEVDCEKLQGETWVPAPEHEANHMRCSDSFFAGPGQQYSYLYPIVVFQVNGTGLTISNVLNVSIVFNAPEEYACNFCCCSSPAGQDCPDGAGKKRDAVPHIDVPSPSLGAMGCYPTDYITNVVQRCFDTFPALCHNIEAAGIKYLAIEYGDKYCQTLYPPPTDCEEIEPEGEQEGEMEGEGEGQPEGETEGEGEFTASANPFKEICGEEDEFEGYRDTAFIDLGPYHNIMHQAGQPYCNPDSGIYSSNVSYEYTFVKSATTRSVTPIPGTVDSTGYPSRSRLGAQSSPPPGAEACSMMRDGVVVAYKYRAQKSYLTVYYGDPTKAHDWDCQAQALPTPNGTDNYVFTTQSYWVQVVSDVNGRWRRIWHNGQWFRLGGLEGRAHSSSQVPTQAGTAVHTAAYSVNGLPVTPLRNLGTDLSSNSLFNWILEFNTDGNVPDNLNDTEREYLAEAGTEPQVVRVVDADGNDIRGLDKSDIAVGVAAGIDIAGNGLASKIADAIQSGIINGTGAANGQGSQSNSNGYGVSFDGSQYGGGSGSDTGHGDGYGTAGDRISGSGGGGTGEGGLGSAAENSGLLGSNLTQDIESFVTTPQAPSWTIDVPFLEDQNLSFTVDFSGETYGFSDQITAMIALFRSCVLVVFVAWWAWCLMRPLFMEGW